VWHLQPHTDTTHSPTLPLGSVAAMATRLPSRTLQHALTRCHTCTRADRDAFKELLRKHAKQSIIQARTPWHRYRESIRKEPEFLSLASNSSGSRPKELFMDALHDIEEVFSKDKARMKRLMNDGAFVISEETEWEDFLAFLQPLEASCVPVALSMCRPCAGTGLGSFVPCFARSSLPPMVYGVTDGQGQVAESGRSNVAAI
jgi:hypothetical protein